MIESVEILPVGNAVRLFLDVDADVVQWKLLRRTADAFTGPTDTGAVLVDCDKQTGSLNTVDINALLNGTEYFYKLYTLVDTTWSASDTVNATPNASYEAIGPDVQSLLRDRIAAGLAVEVGAGRLKPTSGTVKALTAPPTFEDTKWPVVVVRLVEEIPAVRAIGEQIQSDDFDAVADKWNGSEGWYARTTLEISGMSINSDERIAVRKSLRSILVANLPVFEANDLDTVEFTATDVNDFESFSAPVYSSVFTFTCLSPTAVASTGAPVTAVQLEVDSPYGP